MTPIRDIRPDATSPWATPRRGMKVRAIAGTGGPARELDAGRIIRLNAARTRAYVKPAFGGPVLRVALVNLETYPFH